MSVDLFATRPQPAGCLAEHQVRTLPALVYALQHLAALASDRKCATVNLAGVDPLHGATVSLNQDDRGLLYLRFEGLAA